MTVEIRAVWIDGVRYTIEEARVLAKDLDAILASLDTSDKTMMATTFPVRQMTPLYSNAHLAQGLGLTGVRSTGGLFGTPTPIENPEYPRTHLCSTCGEEGHNKQTCKKADRSRTYRCSNCGDAGHNRRTCEWVA